MQLSANVANASSTGNGPSESADDDLPSVMTCANYLKLPPYSTKVISDIFFLEKLPLLPENACSFMLILQYFGLNFDV